MEFDTNVLSKDFWCALPYTKCVHLNGFAHFKNQIRAAENVDFLSSEA